MSADWKVGDLALCVDARNSFVLVEGRTYAVEGLSSGGPSWLGGSFGYGLYLQGVVSMGLTGAFDPRRFRKIRPDEPKACEEEFRILLQLSKKRVAA